MTEVVKLEEKVGDLTAVWRTLRHEMEERIEGIENAGDAEEVRAVLEPFAEGLRVGVVPFIHPGIFVESNEDVQPKVAVGDEIDVWVKVLEPGSVPAINDRRVVAEIDGKQLNVHWGDTWKA